MQPLAQLFSKREALTLCLCLLCILVEADARKGRARKNLRDQGINGFYAIVVGVLVGAATLCIIGAILRRLSGEEDDKEKIPYQERDYITHEDLVSPKIRGEHLKFNSHLHKAFSKWRFVPVLDEPCCHIAFTYSVCKDILTDHASFSSNPYPSERLIALNTMGKADHARVLRFVQSHYTQPSIEGLQERLKAIVTRCTEELMLEVKALGQSDAMKWAKRIHMASTLTRLGVSLDENSWENVDNMIDLNDAMVALVAPLGGVGYRYSKISFDNVMALLFGLIDSIPPLLTMITRLGIKCTWAIIRPDVTIFWPPRHPRSGIWWNGNLLHKVPGYFLALHEMLMFRDEGAEASGPLPGIREGVEAGGLSMAEALTLMAQLMVNMTSANALGSLLYRLATETEAVRELAKDKTKAAAFVQEVLRLDAPLQRNPRRVVACGGKWAKDEVKVGDHVLVFLGAANMDPEVFEAPEEFRLDRQSDARPLSFGNGIHYCLGSSLVKQEMQLALECLLDRVLDVMVTSHQRLVDVDVGNWGFKEMFVSVMAKPDLDED